MIVLALTLTLLAQTPEPKWTGTAGVSLISLSGNASTLTFNGTASAARNFDPWAVAVKAFGTYGQSRVVGATEPQVIALAAGASARTDRSVGDRATAFTQAGLETNHLKS